MKDKIKETQKNEKIKDEDITEFCFSCIHFSGCELLKKDLYDCMDFKPKPNLTEV